MNDRYTFYTSESRRPVCLHSLPCSGNHQNGTASQNSNKIQKTVHITFHHDGTMRHDRDAFHAGLTSRTRYVPTQSNRTKLLSVNTGVKHQFTSHEAQTLTSYTRTHELPGARAPVWLTGNYLIWNNWLERLYTVRQVGL